MKLIITEKPSAAKSIATVVNAKTKKDGYYEGNDYLASWCIGHLLGLAEPSAYDEKYTNRRKEDLPILPVKLEISTQSQHEEAIECSYRINKARRYTNHNKRRRCR